MGSIPISDDLGAVHPPLQRWIGLLALLLVAGAAGLVHVHVLDRKIPAAHNDLIGRWVGTRAALHGQNPYSPQVTRDIQIAADHDVSEAFDYPAILVVLMAPVAALSWESFRLLYLFVVLPSLVVSFWLSLRTLRLVRSPAWMATAVFLAFCSWPVIWGLRMQQPTLPAAILLFLACFLLSRGRGGTAGFLLALASFKPQLMVLLLLWLSVWAVRRRAWGFLLSFAVTEAALLCVAQILVPGWFGHWIAFLREYRRLCNTVPLQLNTGHWIGLLGTLLIAAWSCRELWRLRDCTPDSPDFGKAIALLLAVTVSLTLSDYLMIYNQVLLLPACVLLAHARLPEGSGWQRLVYRQAQGVLILLLAAVPVADLGEMLAGPRTAWNNLPFANQLLPVSITLFLLVLLPSQSRRSPVVVPVAAGA